MNTVLAWLALAVTQATYGPPLPVTPPLVHAGDVEPSSSLDIVLRAQGMSEDGLRTLQATPLPSIARGATRAAQCAVEQLRERDPLPVADLIAAMDERDATAAAQAGARTRYLAAVLPALKPGDQRVLLSVIGDGAAIGGAAPPRPEAVRPGGREDGPPPGAPGQRREGARDGFGQRNGGDAVTGQRAGRPGEGRGASRAGTARPTASAQARAPTSACERYLAD